MYELAFDLDLAIMLAAIIVVWVIKLPTFICYFGSLRIVPPRPPPQIHSLDNSPFKKLPLDLVGYLAEFLAPSAAASLTLTCKPIRHILGNQYLDRLWARDFEPDRRTFLKLLDKDLPNHVVCSYCNQLHLGDKRRHYSLLLSLCGTRPLCEIAEKEQDVHRYINPNFSYVQLQSARKLHHSRYDKEHSQKLYNMLSYDKINIYNTHSHQQVSYIWFTRGRFIYCQQDRFRFCHQNCLSRSKKRGCIECRHGGEDSVLTVLLSLVVCPHLQYPLTETKFESIMTCRASHWNIARLNRTCATCSGLHQCKTCPTEFQFDTLDYSESDRRLILTRWLDLGEGQTAEDPKWTSHIGSGGGGQENPIPFKPGSIKDALKKYQDEHFLYFFSWENKQTLLES